MARRTSIKFEKVGNLNLLPFMNLFAILIPFLLSVAVFEKMGILELNLPERSINQAVPEMDVDPMLLNLTVIITDEYLTVGAGGGFLPNLHYQEEVEYRSKSDGNVFRRNWVKGEEVKSPTDGKVMTPFERREIDLHFLDKKDSADRGNYVVVACNAFNEPLLDSAGEWYSRVPAAGEQFGIVGEEKMQVMSANELKYFKTKKLSVYDEIARRLWQIHMQGMERETPPEDIDRMTILASPKVIYDKIIKVMDSAKYAGFSQLSLSLLGG